MKKTTKIGAENKKKLQQFPGVEKTELPNNQPKDPETRTETRVGSLKAEPIKPSTLDELIGPAPLKPRKPGPGRPKKSQEQRAAEAAAKVKIQAAEAERMAIQEQQVAHSTAVAVVGIIGMTCQFLPPELAEKEAENLIAVWQPFIYYHRDSILTKPWVPVVAVTTLTMLPRVLAKIFGVPAKEAADDLGAAYKGSDYSKNLPDDVISQPTA